ncbi:SynChlorMet cassette protein ScmD [Candidatus Fermentibacterales bacterium]|nr:SynChlorMet cassette protein ScmD [Candidatus Fermentibacterales bacterium]
MRSEALVLPMPRIVLREETDDWAILFDPDTAATFGVNPMGVLVFRLLDGSRTVRDIVAEIRERCTDVPSDAERIVGDFLEELVTRGMAELRTPGGR